MQKNSKTLADLQPGDTATITVRVVDNTPLEFLVVEFGGAFSYRRHEGVD